MPCTAGIARSASGFSDSSLCAISVPSGRAPNHVGEGAAAIDPEVPSSRRQHSAAPSAVMLVSRSRSLGIRVSCAGIGTGRASEFPMPMVFVQSRRLACLGGCMLRRLLDALYLVRRLCGRRISHRDLRPDDGDVGRPPVGINIPAGDDFASWCMAAMAFLGLAHTFKSRRNDPRRPADRPVRGQEAPRSRSSALVVGCGFTAYFAWHAAMMTYQSWRFKDMSQRRARGAAVDSAARLFRRSHHPVDRAGRRNGPCRCAATSRATRSRSPQTAEEVVERAVQSGASDVAHRHLASAPARPAGRAARGRRLDRRRAAGLAAGRHAVRAGGIPAGAVLATTVWGNSASWSWRRCRCSSGWARSSFAPNCRRRCSAGSRPGSLDSGTADCTSTCSPAASSARCRARRPRPARPSPRSRCRS